MIIMKRKFYNLLLAFLVYCFLWYMNKGITNTVMGIKNINKYKKEAVCI